MHYLCVISLLIVSTTAFTSNFNHLLSLQFTQQDLSPIDEKWLNQPLDHFDSNEKRSFKARYFENLQLWKPNGPIYVFIGGPMPMAEGIIANVDMFLMAQLAKETNGALFALEHRYYGKSLPDIKNSDVVEYYKFLNTEQALADLVSLIKMLKSNSKFKSSKVVLIGGWYAGNLATWMRELYPDLVDAAIASSAPVLAKKDFHEYLEVVRYTFGKYGPETCLKNMETTFTKCEKQLKSSSGIENLKAEWNICTDNDMTVLENQQFFFYQLVYRLLKGTAAYTSPHIVKVVCDKYFSSNEKLSLHNLHQTMSHMSDGCNNVDFSSQDFTKLEYAAWIHQVCTEFGYQETTSSEKQPFVHWNPLEFVLKMCKDFIKGDVEKKMDEGIAKTNKKYGGLTPNVTKVVFTHGDMDPWHTLGVLKDLGPDAPATMVNGTSQCGVLMVTEDEPKEMAENRKYVKELIKKWIS